MHGRIHIKLRHERSGQTRSRVVRSPRCMDSVDLSPQANSMRLRCTRLGSVPVTTHGVDLNTSTQLGRSNSLLNTRKNSARLKSAITTAVREHLSETSPRLLRDFIDPGTSAVFVLIHFHIIRIILVFAFCARAQLRAQITDR